jgi:hypothetical protein
LLAQVSSGALLIEHRFCRGRGASIGSPHRSLSERLVALYKRLRTRGILHRAWHQVRSSGITSGSEKTKRAILSFDANWIREVEKIADQLRDERFTFAGEIGHTPPKGKGKIGIRPIVVAPIANRIVRRAILDVLQGEDLSDEVKGRWPGIPAIIDIMATPTSVGGIRGRGVPYGLSLVDQAIGDGKNWYIRSDIKDFFTRIPRAKINIFVANAARDDKFSQLFAVALETNLANAEELEERNLFKWFPDEKMGVAQGSALSALAGNIALSHFDAEMNARGLVCVRYIDDFILLGANERTVRRGYVKARQLLSDMGMDVYDVDDADARAAGKVDAGNIFNGTDFLGYRISGHSRQPSKSACHKFIEKIEAVAKDAKREMRDTARGASSNPRSRYHQSMTRLHGLVWSWSQSFKYTTARQVFDGLDKEVDRVISEINDEARRIASQSLPPMKRRILGIHLLADTMEAPLPLVGQNLSSGDRSEGKNILTTETLSELSDVGVDTEL